MKSSRNKLVGLVILLLSLPALGMTVKKVYRDVRLTELNASLIAALKKNNASSVVSLLSQGADPNSREIPPDPRSQWQRLWDRLRGKPTPSGDGPTALLVALKPVESTTPPENVPLIKALLDAGAKINISEKDGVTPLTWAVITTKRETTELLLAKGAKIDAADSGGSTALLYAITEHDLWLTKVLIAHGARTFHMKTVGIRTPLLEASCEGDADIVRLLLDSGANIDARDLTGNTALSLAAQCYNSDSVVDLLLARGAQVNTKDENGWTPLKWAKHNHNAPIIKMLKDAGAKE